MKEISLIHSGMDFLNSLLFYIKNAKDEICISTFRFENPENKRSPALDALYLALKQAASRKVKIFCLVNLYSETKRLGQINKKSAIILKGYGITTHRPQGNGCNHAKLFIADQKKLILGSHNITRHSFGSNFETSIKIEDHKIVEQTHGIFKIAYYTGTSAF